MKRVIKKRTKNVLEKLMQNRVKSFEKNNPDIAKSLKLFDMSISHYEQALRSLEPVETQMSTSTKTMQ